MTRTHRASGTAGRRRAILVAVAAAMVTVATADEGHATSLINGGFESPDLGSGSTYSLISPGSVPGWSTTDSAIEIWANGFGGVTSYEGTQHAEINAYINGTLSQIVSGVGAGERLGFQFAHRARVGTDVMALTITDLGGDNALGTMDDTVLFNDTFSADTTAWVLNINDRALLTRGNDIHFAYSAISTGSGNSAVGNFLDAVSFGIGVGATNVPVPGAGLLLLTGLGGLGALGRRRSATA